MDWFASSILDWAKRFGRHDLPWQVDRTPYRVWVAEIMLQQTQVKSVIDYYREFVAKFPDIVSLAEASESDVLRLWSGLGYYRRARHLHQAAILVQKNHNGRIPDSIEALTALPGIGRSTAGAIISMGYNQEGVILDGNVRRVLARFHGIDRPVTQSRIERRLWELATRHSPDSDYAAYSQAIMDFGATWCTKHSPECPECVLRNKCQAYLNDKVPEIPVQPVRKNPKRDTIQFILIKDSLNYCLLEQRPRTGIWASLWVPLERSKDLSAIDVLKGCNIPPTLLSEKYSLEDFEHTLSHRKLKISTQVLTLNVKHTELASHPSYRWCNADNLNELPIPKVTNTLVNSVDRKN